MPLALRQALPCWSRLACCPALWRGPARKERPSALQQVSRAVWGVERQSVSLQSEDPCWSPSAVLCCLLDLGHLCHFPGLLVPHASVSLPFAGQVCHLVLPCALLGCFSRAGQWPSCVREEPAHFVPFHRQGRGASQGLGPPFAELRATRPLPRRGGPSGLPSAPLGGSLWDSVTASPFHAPVHREGEAGHHHTSIAGARLRPAEPVVTHPGISDVGVICSRLCADRGAHTGPGF